ncbi:MAG: hypothetical protein HUJ26_15540 [Planctomycetaceae bacterium]|nr:hypothetical protein [Planctomycetaceae bacterium]
MPDWSYRTVFRPILFRLTPPAGRTLAFTVMGRLGRSWWGRHVIEFMGHFKLDENLEKTFDDLTFPSPVGIGCRLDPRLSAHEALAKFGVGLIEMGPVTAESDSAPKMILHPADESIELRPTVERVSLNDAWNLLKKTFDIPVFVRVHGEDVTATQVVEKLAPLVEGFIVEEECPQVLCETIRANESKLLRQVTAQTWDVVMSSPAEIPVDGYLVEGVSNNTGHSITLGRESYPQTLSLVESLRDIVGELPLVIATGGIHEPGDGWQLLQVGADLVLVDTGMVFSGPGLPKRINEAVLSYDPPPLDSPTQKEARPAQMSWFWTLLLGIGLLAGGVMAFLIATTRIVLPYDEAHSGLTRADLLLINPKLLDFMQHDRVTLAGTMLGLGIIYIALSWYGNRGGYHWAYKAIVTSAFVGFFSFFLFLGFGYFDPFHAFVTAIMFQFLTLSMHSNLPSIRRRPLPELTNDADWQRSQWGQLVMVIHGVTLIVAGVIICGFGVTSVFIEDDLEYMQVDYDEICASNPMLLPLVAHDRATFGGMTLSTGLAVLMSGLWGFRRGNRWLWRALMAGGTLCYVMTLWIHWKVGYVSVRHLIPVYLGLAMLWTSGCLSYRHLCTVEYEPSSVSNS